MGSGGTKSVTAGAEEMLEDGGRSGVDLAGAGLAVDAFPDRDQLSSNGCTL